MPLIEGLTDLRPAACAILGLCAYLERGSVPGRPEALLELTAPPPHRPASERNGVPLWPWPEPFLTYENARIPQAMIAAGRVMLDDSVIWHGLRSLRWLLHVQTEDGMLRADWQQRLVQERRPARPLRPAAHRGRGHRRRLLRGLQPHGRPQMAERPGRRPTPGSLGQNAGRRSPFMTPQTGGCRDGIRPDGLNQNQGAESTLAWLCASAQLQRPRASAGSRPSRRAEPIVGAHDFHDLFDRHPGNPIITAASCLIASTPFSTPVPPRSMARRCCSCASKTVAACRTSPSPAAPTDLPAGASTRSRRFSADPASHPEEIWGIEDPRITYVQEEGRWFIAYTAYSAAGPCVALASTTDFRSFERMGPVMPAEDKDAALFPVKLRRALRHDPPAHHLSSRPQSQHLALVLGRPQALGQPPGLAPCPRRRLVGRQQGRPLASTPCLRPRLACDVSRRPHDHLRRLYRLGLALLDRDDPSKVLRRADEWIFTPTEPYERNGDVDEVVFPCGWLLKGDELRMYYGAADTCIAVATASLSDILAWLDSSPAVHRP